MAVDRKMPLTEEQKRRMNENRAKAQAKLQGMKQNVLHSALPSANPLPAVQVQRSTEAPQKTAPMPTSSQKWKQQFHRRKQDASYRNSKFTGKRVHSQSPNKTSYGKQGAFDVLCVLDDHKRFRVKCGFNQLVVTVCKSMKSSRYDPSSCTWSLGLEEYQNFIQRLSGNDEINVMPLPAWILATFPGKELSASFGIELHSIDEKLVSKLMPFQREGVEFGIRNQGRVLIADDMGLGKTIQAIAIASYYHKEWPLLIICPSSVRLMWADELTRWLPSLKQREVCVAFNTRAELSSGLVTIVSYDLAVRLKDQLKAMNFQVVIADECHSLKNHKAVRSKVCLPLLKASKRAILLSGTPALSRPSELYTQVDAVAPKLFPSFVQFGVRYCNGHQSHFGWNFSGASNLEELQLLLEQKLMIRRLKLDVLSQLPEKFRQVVKLDPNLVKTTGLKQAEKEFERAASMKASQKRSALLNFFSETAVAKRPAVVDYVSELMENRVKVLIFAHHKVVMNALCDSLDSKGHQYIRIDGLTAGEDRLSLCNEFQNDPSVLAAVLSVTAANTGINLTSANIVVFTELYWNPGVLIQAEDRVYRIGQKNSVNIRYLVASGTADDYMWPLLQQKLSVLGKAGLSKDDFAQSDCQLHQDSRQEKIVHYFEELVSIEQQAISSVDVDDVSSCVLNDPELFDDWGAEAYEPDMKRPRLQ